VLLPHLGRWLQRDMNETALPIVTALAVNGNALDILFGAIDPQGHYGNGMNLYEYVASNPLHYGDPTGLAWTLFDFGLTMGVVGGVWERVQDYPELLRNKTLQNAFLVAALGWVGKNTMNWTVNLNPGAAVSLNHPVAGLLGAAIGYYMGNLMVDAVVTLTDMGYDAYEAAEWWFS